MSDAVETTAPPAAPAGAQARQPKRKFDWEAHPIPLAVFNIAVALVWTTKIAYGIGLPVAVVLAAGGVGAAGAALAAMIDEAGPEVIWWRLACWIIPTGWAVAAVTISPFQPAVLTVGVALSVVGGLVAYALARKRQAVTDAEMAKAAAGTGMSGQMLAVAPADEVWDAEKPDDTNKDALAANWTARLRRVARIKGLEVPEIKMWPQGTGYTLLVKHPVGGTSWKNLADCAEALADDAGLAPDCGVTVKGSPRRRGLSEVQVTHRNVMAETHMAPADYTPTSIYKPAKLGFLPDGRTFKLVLKWVWVALTGQTDSGKSSLLHLLNLFLFRCRDTVVFHIDVGGGGGISRPWVAPWHEGRAPDPNVAWAATTVEEAELMLRATIAIIEGRKRVYRDRLDNGKLVCSPEVPHIEIISDETASLPERLKDLLVIVNQIGRAAGVRGITSALRATADNLPRDIKQHSRARIGMRVSDADEVRYLFDAAGKVDPALADWQGSGWVEHQDEDADGKPIGPRYLSPFKARFLPDAQIDEAAVAVAHHRPQLDAASVALANSVTLDDSNTFDGCTYDDRWKRTLPHLFVIEADDPEPTGAPDPERAARIAAAEARQEEAHQSGGTVEDRMARLAELKEEILSSDGAAPEVDLEAFAALTRGLHNNLADVLAAVDAAGADGIGPADILRRVNASRAEADQITDKTVQRKLTELIEQEAIVKTGRGRYVAATHADQEGPTDDR